MPSWTSPLLKEIVINFRSASSKPATLVGGSLADAALRALSVWQARTWATGQVGVGDALGIAHGGWESVWWIHEIVLSATRGHGHMTFEISGRERRIACYRRR